MKASAKKNGAPKPPRRRAPAVELKRPAALSEGIQERTAMKAYELWERRGHRQGYDLEDWFDAEEIVREELHEARE